MKSPFEELEIDPQLVSEFFAVFARFEYAMKASRYCRADRHDNAIPNWNLLIADLGEAVAAYPDVENGELVGYLLSEPPDIQKFVDGQPKFEAVPLDGANRGASAIIAARRVRNNLFHGGKHTAHSPPERDTKLMQAALLVLDACLLADPCLNSEFEHQLF